MAACIHKVECILNMDYKFPSWTVKFSKVMTLFSMHITKLFTGLRPWIFWNYFVETKFLELAMSLLDFSPRIPLGTFSILRFAYKTSDIKINAALVLYIPRYIASGLKHNYWSHLLQCLCCLLILLPYKVKWGVIHTNCLITESKMEYYEKFFENEQMYITSMYTINNQIIWLVNWALQ